MFIWRPIMEGLVTLEAVKKGEVDIIDMMKLNSLLDIRIALHHRENERARSK